VTSISNSRVSTIENIGRPAPSGGSVKAKPMIVMATALITSSRAIPWIHVDHYVADRPAESLRQPR
jgi:hypothetical protein